MKAPPSTVNSHGFAPYMKPRKNRSRKPQNNENAQPTSALAKDASKQREKSEKKAEKVPIPPWRSFMITQSYASASVMLHDEIVAFQNWASLTRQELDARRIMLDCISAVVKRICADAKIEFSGSSATSLAFPATELDVVISTQEVKSNMDKRHALSQLAAKLKQANLAKTVVQIPYQDAPILRLITLPEYGSFEADISINNTNELQAVDVANDYLVRMPALRPLVMVIKALLKKHKLNCASTGGLSSYAVTCMCIFFIKTNPTKRPSSSYDYPFMYKSLGTLLSDFLRYFSNQFPYSTSHISAKDGKLYPSKNTFHNGHSRYEMSVGCLSKPDINIAETVTELSLVQIINLFRRSSVAIIKSTVQDHNILACLVTGDKNVRRCMRRLMERGELEALLLQLRDPGWSIAPPVVQSTPEVGSGIAERDVASLLRPCHSLQPVHEQAAVPPVQSTIRFGGNMIPTPATGVYYSPVYPHFPASGGTAGMQKLWLWTR